MFGVDPITSLTPLLFLSEVIVNGVDTAPGFFVLEALVSSCNMDEPSSIDASPRPLSLPMTGDSLKPPVIDIY